MRLLIAASLAAVLLSSSSQAATQEPATRADAAHASPNVTPAAVPIYQPNPELLFVPLFTPCRAFNLQVPARTTKALTIGGTGSLKTQGGPAGGCGVPATASAVAITLSAFQATAAGAAVAWAAGATKPVTLTVSFEKTIRSTTGTTVGLRGGMMDLFSNAPAKFTGDVTGYYLLPLAGFISPSGSPYSGSPRITGATKTATGTYEVTFDRNIRYCAATATVYVSNYIVSVSTWFDSSRPDTARVSIWNNAGAAVDQYFYIIVKC